MKKRLPPHAHFVTCARGILTLCLNPKIRPSEKTDHGSLFTTIKSIINAYHTKGFFHLICENIVLLFLFCHLYMDKNWWHLSIASIWIVITFCCRVFHKHFFTGVTIYSRLIYNLNLSLKQILYRLILRFIFQHVI